MATGKTETGARADQTDRGSGKEGYEASKDALTEFQGGATLDDPEVGPEDQVIVSPYSQQQLDERIQNGEGEAVRQELAEAAEGLKSQRHGGRENEGEPRAKSSKAKKDDER